MIWSYYGPDRSSITQYKVQWKSGDQEYSVLRQMVVVPPSHSTSNYERAISGLTNWVAYTFRIIAVSADGDGYPSVEKTATPISAPSETISQYIENELVEEDGGSLPWLREAWTHIVKNDIPMFATANSIFLGAVGFACTDENVIPGCNATNFRIRTDVLSLPNDDAGKRATFLHELAHVYVDSRGAASRPIPLGVAQLYVAKMCTGSVWEYIADFVVAASGASTIDRLRYLGGCGIHSGDSETREALAVVRSALSGQIPSWFADTYHDERGEPDLERVWADVRSSGSRSIKYQLRDAFGGYCDEVIARNGLNGRSQETTNPWRDGGCVPSAPQSVAATSGSSGVLTVSWEPPSSNGASVIKGYRVQWKSGAEDYSSSRQAEYSEGNGTLAHTTTGLVDNRAYTIRVQSYNHDGDGAWSSEIVATLGQTSDALRPVLVSATVDAASVRLTWNEMLDQSSVPEPSAFSVNVGNVPRTIAGVSLNASVMTLTLESPVDVEDTVTLSYVVPALPTSRVRDAVGNDALAFSSTTVANRTPPAVSISADFATAVNGVDDLVFTLTRTGSTAEGLDVRVDPGLHRLYEWSGSITPFYRVIGIERGIASFPSGSRTVTVTLRPSRIVGWNEQTATVLPPRSVPGSTAPYRVGSPSQVSVTIGKSLIALFGTSERMVEENGGTFTTSLELRTEPGAPRPRTAIYLGDEFRRRIPVYPSSDPDRTTRPLPLRVGIADSGFDYSRSSGSPGSVVGYADEVVFSPSDFVAKGGVFVARKDVHIVSIRDDEIVEGPEVIEIHGRESNRLAQGGYTHNYSVRYSRVRWQTPDGARCSRAGSSEDWDDYSAWCTVSVTIVDDDAVPVITTPSRVVVAEGARTAGTLTAEDADTPKEDLSWSIAGGADAEEFTLTSDGVLAFIAPKDSGTPDDADRDGNYEVTVQVRDHVEPVLVSGGRFYGNLAEAELVVALERADRFPPKLQHATVDRATLVLTWTELLDEISQPGGNAFAVSAGNTSREVLDVSVDGRMVTLTLDASVNIRETVTVSYAVPASADAPRIRDVARNEAEGFSGQAVTNGNSVSGNARPTGLPKIIGTAAVHATLTAWTSDIGDADGLSAATYAWQWVANDGTSDADIPGATWPNYIPVTADVGRTLRVRVTFTDDGGTQETLTSAATVPVVGVSPATGKPTISGPVAVGRTLVASAAEIDDRNGLTNPGFTWQWLVNDGVEDHEIAGATGASYSLTWAEEGKAFKVRVTFTDDSGAEETLTSVATAPVVGVSRATGKPTISGLVRVGGTLMASAAEIDDRNGLTNPGFTWQWLVNDGVEDHEIAGATEASHTLSSDEEGKAIKVRVTFTDDSGAEETLSSAGTAPVAAMPTVSISSAVTEVEEGADALFTLTRSRNIAGDLTVPVVTEESGGMLRAPVPFSAVFGDGDRVVELSIRTVDDELHEPDSTVTVQLESHSSYHIDGDNRASVSVLNDDEPAPDFLWSADMTVTDFGVSVGALDEDSFSNAKGSHDFRVKRLWYVPPERSVHLTLWRVLDDVEDLTLRLGTVELARPKRTGDTRFRWDGVDLDWANDDVVPVRLFLGAQSATVAGAPRDLSVATVEGRERELAVSWAAPESDGGAAITDYRVQWKSGAEDYDGTALSTRQLRATGLAHTIGGLTNGVLYTVRVMAVNVAGDGVAAEATGTAQDRAAPELSGATVNGAALTLAWSEALDDQSVPAAGAFAASVDGTARGVDAVSVSGSAAELTLASAVASGETVAVSYTVPTGTNAAPLRDAAGNAVAGFSGQAVTNETPAPANAEATGAPAIGGTARVGEVLTASVEGIEDADGLTGATFAYRWLSNDGSEDTAIEGATEATYTIAAGDVGKTLKVRVTFTDEGGTEESLESAPTAAVAPALAAVSIAAVSSSVTEGADAAFRLSRTGDASAALSVAVAVSESGAMLAGAPPEAVTFEAGASTAALGVATEDDEAVEEATTVTAAVVAGDGYSVAADAGSATVTAEDDDAAPVVATAPAIEAPENGMAVTTLKATDEDTAAESLTWSIAGGADEEKFTLTEGGVLAFEAAKDYEAPDDADGDGAYAVTVRVSDGVNAGDAALTVTLTDIDEAAPELAAAAVNGTALTLTFREALDEGPAPAADAFTVEVDGAARGVGTVDVSGSAVTLTLASAVASGETVTVGYAVPAGAGTASLRDAAGNAVAGFSGQAVTNETPAPANAEPTGAPAIGGTARVGEVLTASVEGIEDADGLTGATFAYQWLSNDGTGDTAIEGATEATYTVAATDVGRTLAVRVSFTDDGGTEETLESAPTAAVLGPMSLSVADAQVQEGSGATLDFVIKLSHAAVEQITVYYRTHDGTATSGADYTAVDASVVFSPGDTEKMVSVAVLDDAHDEGSETVKFWLWGVHGIAVQQITDSHAVGTILSDNAMPPEAPRNLSLAAPEGREGELVVSWAAPESDGGAAIGGYRVQWKSGAEDYDGTASSTRQAQVTSLTHTIVGLANGVAYAVRVMAVNAAGDGAAAAVTATARDRAAPELSGAAVNGAALALTFSEALDDRSVPASEAFAVTVGGTARGVDAVSVSGSAAELTLASAVASGETVAVSYTVPTGTNAAPLRDAAGNNAAGFSDFSAANETPAPANAEPTGAPTFGGTARVGEVLAASVEGIEDADGLGGVTFGYQWLSNDGTADTPIEGATGATYTVAATDVGRMLTVRVTFTDERGTEETLTSAPTAAVAGAFTARVADVPESHDGSAVFTFELHFSEEFTISYRTLRDVALRATDGTVLRSRRLNRPSNKGWEVHVRPETQGTVSVVLAGNRPCDETGAVCANDGGRLWNAVQVSVPGPASANTAPTGLPVIGGLARVGEVLTASVEGIEDAEGLTGATFAYQWLSNDGTADTAIEGATEATYMVAATDVGRTLTVRVTFTDDGGTEESLESAPTAAVGPALAAVSITAVSSPVTEGAEAAFTLSRSGDASAALSVAVTVSESGAMLAGAPPEAVTFEAGASTAALGVATEDDEAVEGPSTVRAAVAAGDGYTLASDAASATVTAEDDDAAPVVATATAIAAPENGTAVTRLAATDEDTPVADLVWSLAGGADEEKFTLSEGGSLAFKAAKDYEAPDDADGDGAYAVTVRVSDGVNATDAALTVTLSDVDEVAPSLTAAAVNGTALTLTFAESLDEGPALAADAFAVEADGAARGVDTVDVSGSAVTLTLASAVASGETVTVGYAVPTGTNAAPLRDAAGNAVAGFSGQAVTNETPAPANAEATGAPAIGGTARVGEVLTASVEGIEDADGLTGATFAYRWLSNDGSEDTAIEGATEATYTIAAGDVGKTLKVRVTFTDEGGTEESLESAPTAAVAPALAAVSIAAVSSPVTEGADAAFRLSRTGDASAALSVAVAVSESGAMLAGAPPEAVTFEAGASTAALGVATEDDEAVEEATTVTAAVVAGDGYSVAADAGSATVTAEDDDAAPVVATAPAIEAPENGMAVTTLKATDEDTAAESLTWSIAGGADEEKFTLTEGGVLAFEAAKDYEAPDDADGDGAYAVTVRVSDGVNAGDAALTVTLTDIDEAAPELAAAAVNGTALTLTFREALDEGPAPAADAFTVEVDGAARGVGTVDVSGSAVTLTLASAVASGETVTVGYAVPAGAGTASLRDAAGNAVAGFSGQAVTNETPAPANAEPTGAPAIGGTARVGEVLTASVEGIEDADGLTGATFAYQWLSNDGTGDTAIEGATEATYTVAATDVGRTLAVRVSFTDDGGTEETLESAPTAVAPALAAVSIAAVSSPVTEGANAAFTLSRTGDASAPLTVAVSVSQAGSVLDGAAPQAVTFAAGSQTASLGVATEDDDAAEADARVTAAVAAGDGYAVAADAGTAGVDVLDNDRAAPVTVLWSADMAVVDYETGAIGAASADLFSNQGGAAGLEGKWLWYHTPGRTLRVAFTSGIPDAEGLTLHLGGVAVAVPEGKAGESAFSASDINLDWSDGETLAVRLTGTAGGAESGAGAGVAVADAQVQEAAGASLRFRVTLDAPQAAAVSVRYATANGTATAGSDYVAARGAVRFAPGQTARTVEVAVLEDAHDEGSETLRLALSAPFGAELSDAQAVGTIVNTDPVPKAWLARFGRTVAGHVVDAIGERLTEGAAQGGSHVTLGGQRLSLEGEAGAIPQGAGQGVRDDDATARDGLAALADRIGGSADGGVWDRRDEPGGFGDGWMREGAGDAARSMTGRELLLGSSFHLALGGDEDGAGAADTRWTAWGRAAASRFDGDAEGLALDGDVSTFTLGADAAWERWLAGVAVALSEGEGSFRDRAETDRESRGAGELTSTLTSVHPYLRLEVSERLSVWGVLGYGTGGLELEVDGGERWTTDTTMEMAAAGARGVLVPARETGGFELAARTDARLVRMRSEAATGSGGGNLAATEADTSRLRLMLEGARTFEVGGGGTLTPRLEVGLRHDGGDAETGAGIEVGGGVSYTDPASGLTVEAKARRLVAHRDADYREWGASGSVRIEPDASGRGLTLMVAPSWGAAGGGAERLWSAGDARGLAANEDAGPGGGLDAELGYGFSVLDGSGVATPHAGWSRSSDRERLRLGQRLRFGQNTEWRVEGEFGEDERTWRAGYGYRLGSGLTFTTEASRREPANDDAAEHGIEFRATLRW